MRIDYRIDLNRAGAGIVDLAADFTGVPRGTGLVLPVLGGKPGIKVLSLKTARPGKRESLPASSGERIAWPGRDFSLKCSLRIGLTCPAGTDKESELLYPFVNRDEIFLGSGALPYPENLRRLAPGLKTSLRVTGVTAGFRLFSSVGENGICPCQLDSFFMYFSRKQPARHAYNGEAGRTQFSLLVQEGKRIPLTRAGLWRHTDMVMRSLERHFAAYKGFRTIRILVLQPPPDFEKLAGGRTFATGENVAGGVLAYGPRSADYLKRRAGYSSYRFFLLDGLAHELTHFYSTAAWQGRYKSLLFPAAGCPPRHKRLLGEVLTAYFHRAILRSQRGPASFAAGEIRPRVAAWKAQPAKREFLDLLLLDLWLREGGSALKEAFRALIRRYGERHEPYPSARALTRAAEQCRRAALPPWLKAALLTDSCPSYAERLEGFSLKKNFGPLS